MTNRHTEADARIAIDDRLRQAGWDPLDKSMVGTEVHAADSSASGSVVDRSRARPSETHTPLYDLEAAAGAFGSDPIVGTAGDEIGWAPFDAVSENDYNLNASRYKPRVAEAVPDKDPAELIREVLAMEREIAAGLDKLLEEME